MKQVSEVMVEVRNLNLSYDDYVVMHNLNFKILKGEVFIIMGGSGCGKSTLLKSLIGLKPPARGDVLYGEKNFWREDESAQKDLMRSFGVLYQGGALWSSLTLGENVALALEL
ncbi:MAG: ATP-binding cassette domain-containing protein, partial [Candidatus Omnitrophica bacterium]|nr:ATP-binding cassette domain-containing protein [Candidatus Omnitrophota bacterium]